MLPSPPLTADSGSSSPRSLKRSYTDATDDATPPPSQPLKRRRCSISAPPSAGPRDAWTSSTGVFDPNRLVTPPEYAHTPYDPDFGLKVMRQYKKSLQTKRACDAIVSASRRRKYGLQNALAYSPGSTPPHIRSSYEERQRKLDELAEDIIANSDSEPEPEPSVDAVRSWSVGKRVKSEGRAEFQWRLSNGVDKRVPISRDRLPLPVTFRTSTITIKRGCTPTLRSHEPKDGKTSYDGVIVSNGRCNIRASSEYGAERREREEFRGIHIAAS